MSKEVDQAYKLDLSGADMMNVSRISQNLNDQTFQESLIQSRIMTEDSKMQRRALSDYRMPEHDHPRSQQQANTQDLSHLIALTRGDRDQLNDAITALLNQLNLIISSHSSTNPRKDLIPIQGLNSINLLKLKKDTNRLLALQSLFFDCAYQAMRQEPINTFYRSSMAPVLKQGVDKPLKKRIDALASSVGNKRTLRNVYEVVCRFQLACRQIVSLHPELERHEEVKQ